MSHVARFGHLNFYQRDKYHLLYLCRSKFTRRARIKRDNPPGQKSRLVFVETINITKIDTRQTSRHLRVKKRTNRVAEKAHESRKSVKIKKIAKILLGAKRMGDNSPKWQNPRKSGESVGKGRCGTKLNLDYSPAARRLSKRTLVYDRR